MWMIEFYETLAGVCPTKEFLDDLHKTDELPYVEYKLSLLAEFGNQLRRPHTDFLRDGIYELRIRARNRQFRLLYFFFFQDKIIISHGLKKETKVEAAEIEKARQIKADYFARHERRK